MVVGGGGAVVGGVVVGALGEARAHHNSGGAAPEGADIVARSTGNQSSGVLRSMVEAQAILIFPAEAAELREGDRGTVQLLDDRFLSASTPGFA